MENENKERTLVVVGGGAAGFFCAVNAARMDSRLKVILLEKSDKLLSKVKISGGGRCNVTHACFNINEMARKYPRGEKFVKKTFHHFFTQDAIEWFRQRGVPLKTEPDGRMFPVSNSSQSIIDCLLQEANQYRVNIRMKTEVKNVIHKERDLELLLAKEDSIRAQYVVIACGGYPKSAMFDWIRAIGHTIEEPVPSLFTFNVPGHPITTLMGVAVKEARVKVAGTKLEEHGPVLITHWGLSGPAVLRLSAWGAQQLAAKQWHFTVWVNWLPAFNEETLRSAVQGLRQTLGALKVHHKNPFGLPSRLWTFLLQQSGISEEYRWAELPAKEQNKLIKQLCTFELDVKGKTTYKEEFVTAGGIALPEIDASTMMSRKMPGLFFAGEVLNIDGITGGFNFQNAWTTGYIAAKAIAEAGGRN